MATLLGRAIEPLARVRSAVDSAAAHAASPTPQRAREHLRAALAAAGDLQRALVLAALRAHA